MKRVIAPTILIGLFLGATSVPQTFTDDVGYRVHLTSPPQRIISLAPNITEILYQLDLQDKIIAVTQYCDYPPEVKEKPTIGGYINPNLEKIIALKPDLILGFRGNPLPLIHNQQAPSSSYFPRFPTVELWTGKFPKRPDHPGWRYKYLA
ncbi:MAG: hypothetical protein B5M54_04350 [Candidatus Aminicenantes bacterium 4484_214]|nr:MAG: hypothetical protein B5M54_04350 [Candidatus Aminicenantes bacterium 4484_214]